jgi:hypothetical protein
LNRRPSRWQRDALPLSYARILGYGADNAARTRVMAQLSGHCKAAS